MIIWVCVARKKKQSPFTDNKRIQYLEKWLSDLECLLRCEDCNSDPST